MATVVIDAGHGGTESGSAYGGRLEKDDNLRMSLAVGSILRGYGQRVIYTRDSDEDVSRLRRSYISNTSNADLFISIHRNAHDNTAANGVETFVKRNPTNRSVVFAESVLNAVVRAGVQADRGVKEENFTVLVYTYAPAQLLELGFITNAVDNYLFDARFTEYAKAIADGIMRTLGEQPVAPGGDATVQSIQQTLNSRYNAGLAVDGLAGPQTRRAIIRGLQTELNNNFNAGLEVDGIWGPRTRAAVRLLRNGSRGNTVFLMQAMLYIKGYRTTPDGIFGPNTERTVRSFQASNGLVADGIAGPHTFNALFRN